jgi:hypothetical protein
MKPLVIMSCLFGLAEMLAQPAGDEDAKLTAFFKTFLDAEFRQRPFAATRLGDHRFDHLLDDLSPKARARWVQQTRQALEQLPKEVSYDKLTRSGRIDFQILKQDLTRRLWLADNTRPFEEDPRVYNEYVSESIFLPLTQSSLPRSVNVKNCVARMAHIPAIVAAARESLRNPPHVFLDTAIRQNRGAIGFYEHGIFELAGETPQLSALKPAADKVVSCLKDYQHFLENELLPQAHGEWRLGKEKFAKKLELELDAGLTAPQVLEGAEAEFVRVEREMYVIARQLWSQVFPKLALPPDDSAGRRATITEVLDKLNKRHGKVESLVTDARTLVEEIKSFNSARSMPGNGDAGVPAGEHGRLSQPGAAAGCAGCQRLCH